MARLLPCQFGYTLLFTPHFNIEVNFRVNHQANHQANHQGVVSVMINVKSTIVKILKVLVAIEIGWLVLGNLFLNTPIGPWAINMKPEKFSMHWESGWTLYPVKVSMQGIRVNIHTWSMDTEIIVDRAETRIRLLPLLSKRLVVDGLKGGTASIILKREVPDGERPEPAKPYPGLTIDFRNASVESIDKFVFNELTVSGAKPQ